MQSMQTSSSWGQQVHGCKGDNGIESHVISSPVYGVGRDGKKEVGHSDLCEIVSQGPLRRAIGVRQLKV